MQTIQVLKKMFQAHNETCIRSLVNSIEFYSLRGNHKKVEELQAEIKRRKAL
jgi:hypothetical protein